MAVPTIKPLSGKTFTLTKEPPCADVYFSEVSQVTDRILRSGLETDQFLACLRHKTRPFFNLNVPGRRARDTAILEAEKHLAIYLEDVESHIRSLPLTKRFERALRTTRRQYFLYMIEIELVNRLNREAFAGCGFKLAFLPHCLRDFSKECRSAVDEGDIDYRCRRCSKKCYVRKVSDLLSDHGIRPYIRDQVNLKKLFRGLIKQGRRPGVFGMACLPELVFGMRLCDKAGIPAIGVPINANRCRRWLGTSLENSVDLKAVEDLLSDNITNN